MFEKFVADQVKNILTNYRQRFMQWLETSDVDENGIKDREQMIKDFDRLADGIQQIAKGGTDLFYLCASYYEKYGVKEMLQDEGPGRESGGDGNNPEENKVKGDARDESSGKRERKDAA